MYLKTRETIEERKIAKVARMQGDFRKGSTSSKEMMIINQTYTLFKEGVTLW